DSKGTEHALDQTATASAETIGRKDASRPAPCPPETCENVAFPVLPTLLPRTDVAFGPSRLRRIGNSDDDVRHVADGLGCALGPFAPCGQFEGPRCAAGGEMIVLLDVPEVQAGPFFQIGDLDLRCRDVECLLETGQIPDVFLPEDEGRGR